MKKYGVNELRQMFLDFMESKGHLADEELFPGAAQRQQPSTYQLRYGTVKAIFHRTGNPAENTE